MNRRIFIKSAGVTILMVGTPIFAGEKEQQWIRYTDQMPKVGHHISVLYAYKKVREIYCGRVSKSERGNLFIDIDKNSISNKVAADKIAADLGFKSGHMGGCVGTGFTYVDDSVYWIPIRNKLPNKLPKFNGRG